jgi:hypothetical protein
MRPPEQRNDHQQHHRRGPEHRHRDQVGHAGRALYGEQLRLQRSDEVLKLAEKNECQQELCHRQRAPRQR